MSSAPEIHVLDHKVRLLQAADGFRTSLDSIFLGAACRARGNERVLDLGCGASFCLLWRVPECQVTGVEIQPDHVHLARENITLNKMEGRAAFVEGDVRGFHDSNRFDHVICNPPYLEAGTYTVSPYEKKATALGHAGTDIVLKDWIDSAHKNLKSGGSLTMIHRADMTDKIIHGMGKRFGAIEIIPLWPHAGEEAKRVIIRAIKDRKTLCRLHPGIVLHEGDAYTKHANSILRDAEAII
jgi:tRNA1(Val) A37 N6-methylase TrmN6